MRYTALTLCLGILSSCSTTGPPAVGSTESSNRPSVSVLPKQLVHAECVVWVQGIVQVAASHKVNGISVQSSVTEFSRIATDYGMDTKYRDAMVELIEAMYDVDSGAFMVAYEAAVLACVSSGK